MEKSKEQFLQQELEKFAQKRRFWAKQRRKVNLGGKALETLNKEYRDVVQKMNKLDDQIRKDAEHLGTILKDAKTLARRRDYFAAISNISEFHEKTRLIDARLQGFSVALEGDHYRFLLKHLRSLDKTRLMKYDPNQQIQLTDDGLVAEAGIISTVGDWWHNIFNKNDRQRYQAMKALEGKFSKSFMQELREDTFEIIDEANTMFESLTEVFDQLGTAWSTRDVGAYVHGTKEYASHFKGFHAAYVKYHNKYIPKLQEVQQEIEEEETPTQRFVKPMEEEPISNGVPTRDRDFPPPSSFEPESEEAFELTRPPATVGPPTPIPQTGPRTPNPFVHHPDWSESRRQEWMRANPGRIAPKEVLLRPPPTRPSAKEEELEEKEMFAPPTSLTGVPKPKPKPFAKKVPKTKSPIKPESPTSQPSMYKPFEAPSYPYQGGPETLRSMPFARSHQEFIDQLEKTGSVADLIQGILAYSAQLEERNPEESLKLLAIAEGLIEKEAAEKKTKKPKEKEEPLDPFLEYRTPTFQPVQHGLPEKELINQRWSDFPFLKNISASDLHIPSSSMMVILRKLEGAFLHSNLSAQSLPNLPQRLLELLREAITRGLLISNLKCGVGSRPNDCALKVYSYINLNDLYPNFHERLFFEASLRLNIADGTMQLHNVNSARIK